MPARIIAISGALAGQVFTLGETRLTIGRSEENGVVVANPRASRHHAEIRWQGGRYLLVDLGSSNGTLVNGNAIQEQILHAADIFVIGDTSFRFEEGAPVFGRTLIAPPQATSSASQASPPILQQPLPPLTPPASAPGRSAGQGGQGRGSLTLWLGILIVCILGAGLLGGALLLERRLTSSEVQDPPIVPATVEPPAGLPTEAPTVALQPTVAGAEWTILVYLDGDNNLEADALNDFREMAEVGSSDQVEILVQLDRIASAESWDDRSAGDWDGTRRFRITRGMRPEPAEALEDLGELNMGDPAVLADFITWGVATAPAQRYAVIIWDHGAAWLGIASDDSSDGDALTLPELSTALNDARRRTGVERFDLIGFDACLMAQMDVLQTVAPYGLVAVASAELEPNDGWAWDAWLGVLVDQPTRSARELAPVIVDTYIESYRGRDAAEITLSAFDLQAFADLTGRLETLSDELIGGLRDSYNAIGQARSFVTVYAPSYPEEFNAIDLGHFLQLLPEQGASTAINAAALALGQALEQARIANRFGSYHSNSSGLSIYFPQLAQLYISAYELGSPLPRQTKWDDFLQAYHRAGETAIERPTISNLRLDQPLVGPDRPATLTGSVSGSDIAYIFAFIGTPNNRRDTVELLYVDFIYPPGITADGSTPPNWPDGSFDLSLSWDATSWYLNNGNEEIPVLLGPVKYGLEFYGIEGVYRSAATGQEIDAGLVFEVNGAEGRLVRIWGFPRTSDGREPQPYELTPAAGDQFTAFARTYTDTGSNLEPGSIRGATISFSDQPFRVRLNTSPGRDYVMGFLVRDISGNFSYDFVDVSTNRRGHQIKAGEQL